MGDQDDWDDWEEETPPSLDAKSMKVNVSASKVSQLGPSEPQAAAAGAKRLQSFHTPPMFIDNEEEVACVSTQLRNLLLDLADESIRTKVNDQLMRTSFESFIAYYQERRESLVEYTLKKELPRMSVIVEHDLDGWEAETSEAGEIVSVYESQPHALVWALGNQSLFAGLYLALQRSYILPLHLGPGLASVSDSNRLRMRLSRDAEWADMECTFKFLAANDAVAGTGRLELGSITGRVRVDIRAGTLQQELREPHLNMCFDEVPIHDNLQTPIKKLNYSNPNPNSNPNQSYASCRQELASTARSLLRLRDAAKDMGGCSHEDSFASLEDARGRLLDSYRRGVSLLHERKGELLEVPTCTCP
jgi:hypothetical protein